jgi:hypothetical protein
MSAHPRPCPGGRLLLFLEPTLCRAKLVDLVEHSLQECFGRGSQNPCPLKLPDFAASAVHLRAHPLHLAPENGEKPKPT